MESRGWDRVGNNVPRVFEGWWLGWVVDQDVNETWCVRSSLLVGPTSVPHQETAWEIGNWAQRRRAVRRQCV